MKLKRFIINKFVIWGGLKTDEPQYGNILLKILLNAGKSSIFEFAYGLFLIFLLTISVKIAMTWRQSAEVKSISSPAQRVKKNTIGYLPLIFSDLKIQSINNKNNIIFLPQRSFATSGGTLKSSQRLHADDLINAYTKKTRKLNINNSYYLFKRISCSSYSTYNYIVKSLHPAWISGFADGEGCFCVFITKNKNLKTGWQVRLYFQISLHNKDLELITKIKDFFGVGFINKSGKDSIQFRITSLEDLRIIIKHFEKFPLITEKCADFELFKKAFKLVELKEHLTLEGLRKIFAIKASMNRGVSELYEFPSVDCLPVDIVAVQRPLVTNKTIYDPNWLAGFSSAEGCFYVNIKNSTSLKLKFQVELIFKLTQHARDKILMENIIKYLECGNIYTYRKAIEFKVTKFNQIMFIIIPFFQKYPIVGVKALDFADWCEVIELVKEKKHLTKEGLEKICKIKKEMNKGRKKK